MTKLNRVQKAKDASSFAVAACVLALSFATACGRQEIDANPGDTAGSDSASATGGHPAVQGSGASGAGAGGDAGEGAAGNATAAFVIGTRVWDDTTTTSYFNVVSSLEVGTAVDLEQAVEAPGAAKLYAIEGIGWFAVGGGEEPTITRYTLSDSGKLVKGKTISMLQVELVEDLGPSTSDVLWFQVDGRIYGAETTEDYSHTTLIELTAEGGPKAALTAPGFVHGAARVR